MFAKSIVLSDAFLDMPLSARCLYFTLGMFADDDGFVGNPKGIMRQCGASQDDLKLLLVKRYVLAFESGVIVIKHWRMNNYLQKDRHKPTTYLEELSTLTIDEKGAYTEKNKECIQNVYKMYTQVSIGKDSKGEERLGEDRLEEDKPPISPKQKTVYYPNDEKLDRAFADYVAMRKQIKKPMSDRAIELAISKLEKLSKGDNDMAIAILEQSILGSWQGLYELKPEFKGHGTSAVDVFDAWAKA